MRKELVQCLLLRALGSCPIYGTHSRTHVLQGVTQWSIALLSLLSTSVEIEKLLCQAVSRLELLFHSLWLLTLRA